MNTQQPEALRLVARLQSGWGMALRDECAAELRRLHAENDSLYHAVAKEAQKVAELQAENEALRALLTEASADAEWWDKHIYPVRGKAYQNWLLRVYLPVPLTKKDKSVESALDAAIDAARSKT